MMEFNHIQKATNLPSEWDEVADIYFQQKSFLLHTEKYNPCRQRYYTCSDNGKLTAAAIVYSLRLDFLTFIKVRSPVKMNIIGIPCSVSVKGIFGNKDAIEDLKKYILKAEKGLLLFLNLEEEPVNSHLASGKTLPTIILKNSFSGWDDYLATLRSNYRRRLMIINKPGQEIRFEKKPCAEFTNEMYQQYLSVYKRSKGKLEKLNFDFFRYLPGEFILTVCYKNNTIIGWNITLENQNVYYFFLGGIDYKQNKTYSTYLRLLTNIVKEGIEQKATIIELGQTAEIAKMRMGGKPETRYMEAHHSNSVLNKLIKTLSPLLEYRRKLENTTAMKEE